MLVGELNRKAKECFKSNEVEAAKKYYKEAINLCECNNFVTESASLHNNLAHLHLQAKQYREAYFHSDACIEVLPDNAKVWTLG